MWMSAGDVKREQTADGHVLLTAAGCVFSYERLRLGTLLVTIRGSDAGQFGTSTLDEIRMELLRQRPLELFVDARDALGPTTRVSDEWTHFFSLNREHLRRVSVLVGSKVVHLTVAIAQHLSRTGELIRIYSDPAAFGARVAAARRAVP